ncbi:MAG: cytoplasmic protein [Bacteroidota bacterium]|nr:cytoplasmic protein [Bacteroidota bacterium]
MTKVPDVLQAASKEYTLLLDNDKVRVMELRLKPGQKAPMHNHPNDHVVFVMEDAKFRLSFPDGKSQDVDLKSGKVIWMGAGQHETENVGTTNGYNLVIEVK